MMPHNFSKIGLKETRTPRAVSIYNVATLQDFSDDTAIIQTASRATNPFVERTSKPLFVFQNPQSRYRQVGEKRYYKDSILFWESVNKIMEGRTVKHELGDISTGYILSRFDDKTYRRFFKQFYTSLSRLLQEYAAEKHLSVPEDIALFYKGGNLFRIILTPFVKHIKDNDYLETLKKRSDADFQIYIRTDLLNYATIYDDILKRVLVCLYDFKKWLSDNRIITVDPTDLIASYTEFFAKMPELNVTKVALANNNVHPFRNDCVITNLSNATRLTAYKEEYSLLTGVQKCRDVDPSLYISRNTASDFTTYTGKRYLFELLRLKRNIKIVVEYTENSLPKKAWLQVPSEVIDVSIPKIGDSSLESMKGNITEYLTEYIFQPKPGSASQRMFTFWGVSLNYLLYDLTDILYYKFEWPWLDAKYSKRLARFLLCMVLANINTPKAELLKSLDSLIRRMRTNSPSSRQLSPTLTAFYESNQQLHARVLAAQDSNILSQYKIYSTNVIDTLSKLRDLVDAMEKPTESLITRMVGMVGGRRIPA